MKLLTKEALAHLPPLYAQEKKGEDAIAYVKFFTPDSNWTWYATEYDPEKRLFFGLVVGFETELGYFSLDELENARGPMGLHIERDMHWHSRALRECRAGGRS
jgi:hypothetical protein